MKNTFTGSAACRILLVFVWTAISAVGHAQLAPTKGAASPGPAPAPSVMTSASASASNSADNLEYYKILAEAQTKVAEGAIQSSQKAVDTIKDVIFFVTLGIGLLSGLLGFLGFREYKSVKALRNEAIKSNEDAKKELADMTAQKEEYKNWIHKVHDDLKTQFDFFSARFQFELYSDMAREEEPFRLIPSSSKEMRPRMVTELEKIRQHTVQTPETERMLSWVRATLAILHRDAGNYIRALELGEESYNSNPAKFADRAFNCACYASLAYQTSEDPDMLLKCALWLKRAIAQDANCAEDASLDGDLRGVLKFEPIMQLLTAAQEPAQGR